MDLAILAKELYTPLERIERPVLLVQDGVIAGIGTLLEQEAPQARRVLDLGESILVPGFIDMHIHGGAGRDVMDASPDALPAVERLLYSHGVTSYFPTTITAPMDGTLRALEHLGQEIERASENQESRARPVGIHLEGPFISHARPGVHPVADLQKPSLPLFERMWEASRGTVKVITIAPELPGARELISEATRRGVCVSMGHSDADLAQAQAGVDAGVRHATHTFNAMRPLDHRDPGIIGETLTDKRISAEIIADGIHVDPVVVRLFLRAKGAEGAVLVTDATAATGMPNGRYQLGSLEVEVKDGKCLHDGRLAGSVLTMDRAVRNIVKFANWDLQRAVQLATLNPARTTGLTSNAGQLVAGAPADIVALNASGEVVKTIVRGQAA
jgi:N-acetylglucosamine-6-phosphate deacetylase